MDLRDKFLIDLFDVMHEMDKGNPDYTNLSDDQKIKARAVSEGMIKRGWFLNHERIIK